MPLGPLVRSSLVAVACLLALLLPGCASSGVTLSLQSYETQWEVVQDGGTTRCGDQVQVHVVTIDVHNGLGHALDTQKHGWLLYWPDGSASPPFQRDLALIAPGGTKELALYACQHGSGRAHTAALLNSTSLESEAIAEVSLS